jgi:hypothetical protein
VNTTQRKYIASFLLDIAKGALIVFFVGGFVPETKITLAHVMISMFFAAVLFVLSMRILRGCYDA